MLSRENVQARYKTYYHGPHSHYGDVRPALLDQSPIPFRVASSNSKEAGGGVEEDLIYSGDCCDGSGE